MAGKKELSVEDLKKQIEDLKKEIAALKKQCDANAKKCDAAGKGGGGKDPRVDKIIEAISIHPKMKAIVGK